MDNSELNRLLRAYLDQKISAEQTAKLQIEILEIDDDELDSHLFQIWEQYSEPENWNISAYHHVMTNLNGILQPGKTNYLFRFIRYAAAVILLTMITGVSVYYFTKQQTTDYFALKEYQIVTDNGQRASIILPDRSIVTINANSSLSYAATFGKEHRDIILSGEAYFEVTHNEKLPFVVKTAEASVKVLGTKFNISAYPSSEWFEATLIEGAVEVFINSNPLNNIYLKPNEKIRYNLQSGELLALKSDSYIETAWKRGDIVFVSESIQQVFAGIERYYGVTVHTSGDIPEKLFTATYHEDDVNQVLNNMQLHYNFTIKKTGNDVYISFK